MCAGIVLLAAPMKTDVTVSGQWLAGPSMRIDEDEQDAKQDVMGDGGW